MLFYMPDFGNSILGPVCKFRHLQAGRYDVGEDEIAVGSFVL
jgi:hypothetical protein